MKRSRGIVGVGMPQDGSRGPAEDFVLAQAGAQIEPARVLLQPGRCANLGPAWDPLAIDVGNHCGNEDMESRLGDTHRYRVRVVEPAFEVVVGAIRVALEDGPD